MYGKCSGMNLGSLAVVISNSQNFVVPWQVPSLISPRNQESLVMILMRYVAVYPPNLAESATLYTKDLHELASESRFLKPDAH